MGVDEARAEVLAAAADIRVEVVHHSHALVPQVRGMKRLYAALDAYKEAAVAEALADHYPEYAARRAAVSPPPTGERRDD